MINFHQLRGTRFRQAAALAVVAMFLSNASAPAAPSIGHSNLPTTTVPTPGDFRVLSYLRADSQCLVVHLDNPQRERITVQVINQERHVVYEKFFGQPATFVSKFNLTGLPNGEYTFLVKGRRSFHKKRITLQTTTQRVIQVRDH